MAEQTEKPFSSSVVAPAPLATPARVDLEATPGKQIHCRVCLRSDGRDLISPCMCKGAAKFVHRACLDYRRSVREKFAFSHCTTCKAPYYLRAHIPPDRKWRILKFLKFRYVLLIFIVIQLVICMLAYMVYLVHGNPFNFDRYPYYFDDYSYYYVHYPYWWLFGSSFSRTLSLSYAYGVLLFCTFLGFSGCFIACYNRRIRTSVAQSCQELRAFCCQTGVNECTTFIGSSANKAAECGFIGETGQLWLQLLFIMELFVLGFVTGVGIFYSILVASVVGQQIWKHHYRTLAIGMLAREYVVDDMDGEVADWCPPPLPPEHVKQLKELGLL